MEPQNSFLSRYYQILGLLQCNQNVTGSQKAFSLVHEVVFQQLSTGLLNEGLALVCLEEKGLLGNVL